jgi:hypothetical protein
MAKRSSAPTREILEAALQGLEAQRQKLEEQISRVRAMMGHRVGRPAKGNGAEGNASKRIGLSRKKRSLSAEARKRIAAAQKKRWAAFRKNQA